MAFVPGFRNDVFVSYAHGDNRKWIDRLAEMLQESLEDRLGSSPTIWIDDDDLRRTLDFQSEIPEALRESAVFMFLPSPLYLASRYCVQVECRLFEEQIPARRQRFKARELANSLFAVRCPILPIEKNEHYELVSGLTDIGFFADDETLPIGSPLFRVSFRRVIGELVTLLKAMRNDRTSVFLYPRHPPPELKQTYDAIAAELTVQSYRILPDREVRLAEQLHDAAVSVFLLGKGWDAQAETLTNEAKSSGKPWIIWRSPEAKGTINPTQLAFGEDLLNVDSPSKSFFDAETSAVKLRQELLTLLRPDPMAQSSTGKPRVYLVYDPSTRADVLHAGRISRYFHRDFDFDIPDDLGLHTARLSNSAGVLLVWGNAEESWCANEFADMMTVAVRGTAKGLCLFDPREDKAATIGPIRETYGDLIITEQFGEFDPGRFERFFSPLRQRASRG